MQKKTKKNQDVKSYEKVAMDKIKEPEVVARQYIDKDRLEELSKSIAADGLIQPIILKRKLKYFEIIAGHRRFLACRMLGWKEIEAIIVNATDTSSEIQKLQENMMRDDLSDVEEAIMIKRLKEITKLKEKDLGARVGKSDSYVRQKLEIFKYPSFLYEALFNREIKFSVARELFRIEDEDICRDYTRHAIRNGITPAIAKSWADGWIEMKQAAAGQVRDYKDVNAGGGTALVFLPCDVCSEQVNYLETKMIRMCVDCQAEVQEIKKIEREVLQEK